MHREGARGLRRSKAASYQGREATVCVKLARREWWLQILDATPS